MSKVKQIWVRPEAKTAICEYCNRHQDSPNQQVIGTRAILLGLAEMERQEKALKKEKELGNGSK